MTISCILVRHLIGEFLEARICSYAALGKPYCLIILQFSVYLSTDTYVHKYLII